MCNGHLISTAQSIDSADGESGSKTLHELGVKAGNTLMVLCTTIQTIQGIHESDANVGKFDGRRDFAQEEELQRQRREAAPMYVRKAHGSVSLLETHLFHFCLVVRCKLRVVTPMF